jgi:hypothetical protein
MPLINLNQAKTLLQINVSTYDTLINMLIPIIENEIVEYCNNEFIATYESLNGIMPTVYMYSNTMYFTTLDNSLNDDTEDFTTKNFKTGDVLRVYNSLHNDRMYTIISIATHKIILDSINIVNDESSGNTFVVARVDFPETLKFTASRMIKWGMQKYGFFKQEKFDDYSYTRDEKLVKGYPESIISGLNDYRSLYRKTIPSNILYYRQI